MPSLNDAYNELLNVNTNLQTLHADNGQIINGQTAIQASVDAGTAILKLIAQQQKLTNQILFHLSQQADTMICSLEAISRNTCALLNEEHTQTGLLSIVSAADGAMLDICRTVHPGAALDLERREALRKATDLCCPPPVEPPVCNFRPCAAPRPLRDLPSQDPETHDQIR